MDVCLCVYINIYWQKEEHINNKENIQRIQKDKRREKNKKQKTQHNTVTRTLSKSHRIQYDLTYNEPNEAKSQCVRDREREMAYQRLFERCRVVS